MYLDYLDLEEIWKYFCFTIIALIVLTMVIALAIYNHKVRKCLKLSKNNIDEKDNKELSYTTDREDSWKDGEE